MHQPWTLRKRHTLVLRIHAENSVESSSMIFPTFPDTLWFLSLAACADAWNILEVSCEHLKLGSFGSHGPLRRSESSKIGSGPAVCNRHVDREPVKSEEN